MNEWIIDGQYKIKSTANDIFTWMKIENFQNKVHSATCEELSVRYDTEHKIWIGKSKL